MSEITSGPHRPFAPGEPGSISNREFEARLQDVQKLETLARVTSAVAHDLNNHMAVMLIYSKMLMDRFGVNDPLLGQLAEIHRAAEHSASMTQRLLDFSHKQEPDPRPVDLNNVITAMEPTLQQLVGHDIALVTKLEPGLSPVRGTPGQF